MRKEGILLKKSLGLIETIGMAAAVEAADAAVKSANVKLIGIELTKGFGMVTVKIAGDVGAVKAAVSSAKAAAERVNQVVSVKVIARPSKALDMLIFSPDTVGEDFPKKQGKKASKDKKKSEIEPEKTPEGKPETITEPTEKLEPVEEPKKESKPEKPKKGKLDLAAAMKAEAEDLQDNKGPETEASCNLCKDPACPRKKGDPRKICIHYGEEV
jgi:microcompartment protein CcmL/EutN